MTMPMRMGLTMLAAAATMMRGYRYVLTMLMLITSINITVVRAVAMVDTDDEGVSRRVCPRELEVSQNMLYDNPMSKDGQGHLSGRFNPFYHGRGLRKRTNDCDPVV